MDYRSQEFGDYLLDSVARVLVSVDLLSHTCKKDRQKLQHYLSIREEFISEISLMSCFYIDMRNGSNEFLDDSAFNHIKDTMGIFMRKVDRLKDKMDKLFQCDKTGCCTRRIISWEPSDEHATHA